MEEHSSKRIIVHCIPCTAETWMGEERGETHTNDREKSPVKVALSLTRKEPLTD